MQTLAAPPEPPPLLDELDDMEVGAALLDESDEDEAALDEAEELSCAKAPVAAMAARRATGTMLNFILTICFGDGGREGQKDGDGRTTIERREVKIGRCASGRVS